MLTFRSHISHCLFVLGIFLLSIKLGIGQHSGFAWPEGKQMAMSLTFDDARYSQVDTGTSILNTYQAKATFYVIPGAVAERLEGWKAAVDSGHEIGNHSLIHPCTGNFAWARDKALETYSLKDMQRELITANKRIDSLLGIVPTQFAYPCGQSFVGRGTQLKSYVPLIAKLFESGRGWLDEGANDPTFCDMAQLLGVEMDGKEFEELLPAIEQARGQGAWLVLAGHEMGVKGSQTTRLHMLEELIQYAQKPESAIWLATVGEIAAYIQDQRE